VIAVRGPQRDQGAHETAYVVLCNRRRFDDGTMFTFTYILSGSGWSEARITNDGEALTLRVSYLSDALRDLTDSMIALMRGATHASCSWQGEDVQHEYRWIFDQDNGDVHVKIVEFDSLFSRKADYQGTTIFSTRCPRRRLVGQVLNQL
jgi:hypothetical protein